MSRLLNAGWRMILEMAQALALLPFYAKVLVAIGLTLWVVTIAEWNKIFPPAPAAKLEQTNSAHVAPTAPPPVSQKVEDRVATPGLAAQPGGSFIIADPHVRSDGSIREGEDGKPFFLSGLKAFNAKDVCVRADGERWACGLHAYATLRNLIEHKPIQCTTSGTEDNPTISCRMDGQNVALNLVKNGLVALEHDVEDQTLLNAQEKAKAGRVGIWDR